jgi:aryl-alcohol dehydrogenase-like predicted oxidoreductase
MLPLCANEHIQTMVYSPLASGRLARPWGATTDRSKSETSQDEATAASDQKIIETVGAVAQERGVSQAAIGLAWLYSKSVVATPIVGALKAKHIDEAITATGITLNDDEIARLETPYTPRIDHQNVSDPGIHMRAAEAATGFKVNAA